MIKLRQSDHVIIASLIIAQGEQDVNVGESSFLEFHHERIHNEYAIIQQLERATSVLSFFISVPFTKNDHRQNNKD